MSFIPAEGFNLSRVWLRNQNAWEKKTSSFPLLVPQSFHGQGIITLLTLQIIQLIEGKASAYVFASPGCKKWDTCAPEVILHAVGG